MRKSHSVAGEKLASKDAGGRSRRRANRHVEDTDRRGRCLAGFAAANDGAFLKRSCLAFTLVLALCLFSTRRSFAESQDTDYRGVTDPFSDPTNYEFAEDEKEDKEFFHLGRYLMFGLDTGAGIFTGELGRTTGPSFYVGLKLLYFFDKAFALETAGHYAQHNQQVANSSNQILELNVTLIPITAGFRYYFDTKAAPKAIAIANPYLAFGAGGYIRTQNVIQDTAKVLSGGEATSSSFGGYAGGGVEFSIYRRHLYLGVDLRYHLIFFNDETQKFFVDGDRGGDYFTGAIGITYNF